MASPIHTMDIIVLTVTALKVDPHIQYTVWCGQGDADLPFNVPVRLPRHQNAPSALQQSSSYASGSVRPAAVM